MFDDSDYTKKFGDGDKNPPSGENPPQDGDSAHFYSYDLISSEDDGVVEGSTIDGGVPEVVPARQVDTGDLNFKMNFDFDGEYRDLPSDRPLRQRRQRRTGCLGGIMYAVFIICVSLLLASLTWMAATDVLGFGSADEEVVVTVPKEFTIQQIADTLYDNGLIQYKALFLLYAGFSDAAEKYIAPGTYTLNKNFDYRALVHGMSLRGGTRVQVTVAIPEGYTLSQIFTLLDKNAVCTEAELWDAAQNYDFDYDFLSYRTLGDKYRLEGYLFPETYNFYVGSTPQQAISRLLDEFKRRYTEEFATRAGELGYTQHEILTIASMIEREAADDSDRDKIASVIYNRLNSPDYPRLEIDATIYYAMQITGKPFSVDLDNPYNTRVYEGLPPGPIANPGLASIRAALYPAETDFYYYALGSDKVHHQFFKTYAEHVAFVESDEYGG